MTAKWKRIVFWAVLFLLSVWILGSSQLEAVLEIAALKWQGAMPGVGLEELGYPIIGAVVWGVVVLGGLELFNPFDSSEDAEAGANLFRSNCAGCHGADGTGGTQVGLVHRSFRRGNSDRALYQTISQGLAGTMPAFGGSTREVWQLASFIRSLNRGGLEGNETARLEPCAGCVTYERLVAAEEEPENWLTYSGSYKSHRYSRLAQIHRGSLDKLRLKWVVQFETLSQVKTTPLVVDGVMYLTHPMGGLMAVDTTTGRPIWHTSALPDSGWFNRGLAMLDGRLYVGAPDAHLRAIDASNGSILWEKQVVDRRPGYTINAAPLAVKDKIIVGISGGDYGVRGFIDAYEAESGQRAWRFYTVPGPDDPGHETWSGDSWKTGGAATWLTGSFDPQLNLLYWGTGNPAPVFVGDQRQGDNLYSCSVVALDVDTGRLKWHFQFTPHDLHDWDANQIPVLVDGEFQGRQRRLMLWANRNGFFYVLDRVMGEFLSARPFVRQNWAAEIDPSGRPKTLSNAKPTAQGTLIYPSDWGATNWWSPSLSSSTRLLYVPFRDHGSIFSTIEQEYSIGQLFLSGVSRLPENDDGRAGVLAIEPQSGDVKWEFLLPSKAHAGVLSTAGDLVFVGSQEGYFFALDANTGEELWRKNIGGEVYASPISYLSDGEQQVAIAAGGSVFAFGLEE